MSGANPGGAKTTTESGADLLYDIAAASMIVVDHVCQQWTTWLKMPLEFAQAENPMLEVHSTTVYFPKTPGGSRPAVATAQLMPDGSAARLEVISCTDPGGGYLVVGVQLRLRTQAFAVCSFSLCDPDNSNNSKAYVLPFGVPGGTV